jgi:hypothetical protein
MIELYLYPSISFLHETDVVVGLLSATRSIPVMYVRSAGLRLVVVDCGGPA